MNKTTALIQKSISPLLCAVLLSYGTQGFAQSDFAVDELTSSASEKVQAPAATTNTTALDTEREQLLADEAKLLTQLTLGADQIADTSNRV